MRKNWANWWRLLGALSLLLPLCTRVEASELQPAPDPVMSSHVGCLNRGEALRLTDEELAFASQPGQYMRVLLTFTRPDAAPTTQVIAATAPQAIQDRVVEHVKRYRLPCLGPTAMSAVQEFHFRPSTAVELPSRPVPSKRQAENCIVKPAQQFKLPSFYFSGVIRVLARATFDGDAEASPKVQLFRTFESKELDDDLQAYVKQYRASCRTAADEPETVQLVFILSYDGFEPAALPKQPISLVKFLRGVKEFQKLQAYFDFRTTACPFQVKWTSTLPLLPNSATATDDDGNANRRELLSWLASLELNLNADQAMAIVGDYMLIDIPCGTLNLKG